MVKKIRSIITSFIIIYSFILFSYLNHSLLLSKGYSEELYNEENYEDYDSDDEGFEDESMIEFEFKGYTEFETFINTYKDQERKDANKKNELKNNIKIDILGEYLQFKMDINIYINSNIIDESINNEYFYSKDFEVFRNLRISDKSYEIIFNELFLTLGTELFRLRIGNQKYGWGTADAINPTTYFNPQDARELLFRDEDESRLAIPSASGMIFIGDYTLELVFAPIHIPMPMAETGNFWEIKYKEGPFPVKSYKPKGLDINSSNFAYGGRLSGSYFGSDISLSGYHGPDKDPTIIPNETSTPINEPVEFWIKPEYYTVNYMGIDFSKTFGPIVMQFETIYSPDKTGVIDQDMPNTTEELEDLDVPFEIEKSDYISYSVGFNYFIPLNRLIKDHEGTTLFTFEWHQSIFLDDKFMPPMYTDILLGRIQDDFFNSFIHIAITGAMETQNMGHVIWPEIGLDFQNGFTIKISYVNIKDFNREEDRSIFVFYDDNDIIMIKLRYEF